MTTFENWCALNGKASFPAAPADVAKFITDCAELGMDTLWPMVQEISRAHYLVGLADPTLGGWVARAINDISGIVPPRSWPKDDKARFLTLPYDVQQYLLLREAQREITVRRAMSEAGQARKELKDLAAIQQAAEATNGTQNATA